MVDGTDSTRGRRARRARRGARDVAAAAGVGAGAVALVGSLLSGAAQASTSAVPVVVNSDSGAAAGSSAGTTNYSATGEPESLADAIAYVDAHGGGTITFASQMSGHTITMTTALPEVTVPAQIEGPGANRLTLNLGGQGDLELNSATPGASHLTGMTITDGQNIGGGDLTIESPAIIEDVALSGGSALGGGGAYVGGSANGYAEFTHCSITGNQASVGGGMLINSPAVVSLQDVTIANNSAGNGGGIDIGPSGSSVQLVSSTVVGNSARAPAAESTAGGINQEQANVTLINSVVSGNTASGPGPNYPDVYLTSAGWLSAFYSLIGNGRDAGGRAAKLNSTDIVGTLTNPANAKLGPLQNDAAGLPVMTPLPGSPLVDNGDAVRTELDELGHPRVEVITAGHHPGDGADIGAVEVQPAFATAKLSGQTLAVGVPPKGWPVAGSGRLPVTLSLPASVQSGGRRLRLSGAELYVDGSHKPAARSAKASTVVTVRLRHLRAGTHTLAAVVTFTRTIGIGHHRHTVSVTKRLSVRFTVS